MADHLLETRVAEKIAALQLGKNSILVLKGIPLSMVEPVTVDLAQVVSNKLGYFMSVVGQRSFLSYEEFLLLSDFVVSQYKEVVILNNNLYMEQYPIGEHFNETIRAGLLNHYAESEGGETNGSYIGDIDEYAAMFQGLKECNGQLIGVYCPVPVLQAPKVRTVDLFDNRRGELVRTAQQADSFVELVEESDYVDLVRLLLREPERVYIRILNYTGDLNRLQDHLAMIVHYWKGRSSILCLQAQGLADTCAHRGDYGNILKKYWGYETFRSLEVYDMNALDQGEKLVKQVSQENIIANIVEQVEHCGDGRDFRDIFVTAPTGAGKSVMFQLPAIYLAEKYGLLTLVISPLIGLMYNGPLVKTTCRKKCVNQDLVILILSRPEPPLNRPDNR